MHFFLFCISSQGSTLSCLAAVLYLFHIFHMVSSRFLLQSQHCTVFRVRLYVLLSHNSLSKYLVKGTGSTLSFFFICTWRWEQPADRERHGSDGLQTALELEGKFFPSNMLLPAQAEAEKILGRVTQAAGLCHCCYLIPCPVLQIVANFQIPFY